MHWNEGIPWSLASTSAPYVEPLLLIEAKLQCRVESAVTAEDDHISALIQASRAVAESDGRRLVLQTWLLTLDRFPCGRIIEIPCWPVQSVTSITYIDIDGNEQTLDADTYRVDTRSSKTRIELNRDEVWPSTDCRVNAVTVTFVAGYRSEFTAATSDLLTLLNPSELPINGRVVRVTTSGTLPAGLAIDTDYYVINAAGKTCKLSATSGGSVVDITSAGTGTHYIHGLIPGNTRAAMKILIAHLYENRTPVEVGTIVTEVPFSAKALLDVDRVYEL